MQQITKNQLKYITRIKNNSNFRKKEGKVYIEGEHNIIDILKNKPNVIENILLVSESQINDGFLNNYKSKILTVNLIQAKKLSFGNKPFKIAGLVDTSHTANDLSLKYTEGIYVGLVNVQDPFNVGTIFRTCEAFGIKGVLLFDNCANPYNQKVVISSTSSVFKVPFTVFDSSIEFIYKNKDVNVYGTAVPQVVNTNYNSSATKKQDVKPDSSMLNLVTYDDVNIESGIILFGNEGTGLGDKILNLTKQNLYIPIKTDSLNISVSAGIILSKLA